MIEIEGDGCCEADRGEEGVGAPVRLQMGDIDHDALRLWPFAGQRRAALKLITAEAMQPQVENSAQGDAQRQRLNPRPARPRHRFSPNRLSRCLRERVASGNAGFLMQCVMNAAARNDTGFGS